MKLAQHAPTLKTTVYYGGDRDLSTALKDTDVLITSYGLLLRDIDQLTAISFSIGVFDEIQSIKNADTKTHRAASQINAAIKLGLTGTPIENSILELKALMDVVVPGYLGSDQAFAQRFAPDATADADGIAESGTAAPPDLPLYLAAAQKPRAGRTTRKDRGHPVL